MHCAAVEECCQDQTWPRQRGVHAWSHRARSLEWAVEVDETEVAKLVADEVIVGFAEVDCSNVRQQVELVELCAC